MRRPTTPFRLVAGLVVALLLVAARPASAAIGDWVTTTGVKVRLVGTSDRNGVLSAVLEFSLDQGWKTYWRSPGLAGLPPVFDTSASWNLGAFNVQYPPPQRYDDGFSTTNVYSGRVLLPITLIPAVAGAPVSLSIAGNLGVCDVVCIPVRFETGLVLTPAVVDQEALAIVEEARALIPTGPVRGQFEVSSFQVVGTNARNVVVSVTMTVPQSFGAALFVEGPTDWIAQDVRQTGGVGNVATFQFTITRPTAVDPTTGVALRLTAVSGGRSIEQTIRLP
ncbi:MAG: protein-disulfide reductase DsbD domain-containing protein [Bauldia sp.]